MLVGYRIIPVQLLTNVLKFKKLGIWYLAWRANTKTGIKNMTGTMKRFYNIFKASE
jgi:hypothetical protein